MSDALKRVWPYILLHGFAVGSLFLYSFTQVDLNLTLSRISLMFAAQDFFQFIGYFNRPLSTGLYGGIMVLLFVSYGLVLHMAVRKKITAVHVWLFVGLTSIFLLFSYPAFSYDIYNYMFDARIVTEHAQNPYVHKALDYPDDPWINFMRWTHRTYPYGPLWLVVTVPLTFITLGRFLPALVLFKLLMAAAYIISVWAIQKIQEKVSPEHVALSMAAFALNPLVVIESLVSSHNDIVMMAIVLVAFLFLIEGRQVKSWIYFILSALIKFATGILAPVFLWVWWNGSYRTNESHETNKRTMFKRIFLVSVILMICAVIAATIRTQFQPWYLLYVLPFAAFTFNKYYVAIPVIVISLAGLMQYVPFLYLGNWDTPVPDILNWIMIGGVGLSVIVVAGLFVLHKQRR